jgi:uncharacterized protein
MQMTCPKCHGEMRQYERSGVIVDQCTECRGVFLDRGELEKLYDAEANWNQAHTQPSAPAPAAGQPAGGYVPPPPPPPSPGPATHVPPPPMQHGYPAPVYRGHYGYRGHHHRKRKGFMHELFD